MKLGRAPATGVAGEGPPVREAQPRPPEGGVRAEPARGEVPAAR